MSTVEYYQPNEAEQRLIVALRSGRYKQGRDVLEANGKLCCLGVACRVSSVELDINLNHNVNEEDEGTSFNGEIYELPPLVMQELGWSTSSAVTAIQNRYGDSISLTSMNDDGLPFPCIADVIEAGLVRRAS